MDKRRMNVLQLKFCLLVWTVMNRLVPTRGSSFKLHTEPQQAHPYVYTKLSSYGYKVGTSTCIVFEYKGCTDAYIGLMREDDDSKLMYEINLGSWTNTLSYIRVTKYSYDFKTKKAVSGVVDCNESRRFKIGWKNGKITTYRWVKPCKWEEFMSWHNTLYNTSYSVNYIGVTTGIWANGDWVIANNGCHELINRNTLWKNDVTRKDIVFSAMFIKPDIDSSHQCAMQCQRYSDCCYYTYNRNQQDCRGYTNTSSANTSIGTHLWIRY